MTEEGKQIEKYQNASQQLEQSCTLDFPYTQDGWRERDMRKLAKKTSH